MMIKKIVSLLALSISIGSFGQQMTKEVLFKINDQPYYTDEFVRVYNKNLDLVKDESQKDVDNYLDLYLGYKLKVAKAYDLGLDKNPVYQREFNMYRNQLAKQYQTDAKVTDELVFEAYDRMKKEVRASHILLTLADNATPQDTLKVFQRITEIRNQAINGEDFNQLAKEHSEDPSAAANGGDLGYFSAFKMVYPFETAAYTTPVGQISKPVRTRFGYHLVKVTDVRDNRGDISVAHIMILKPSDMNEEGLKAAKNRIDQIASKIKQGENYEELAKQFSEDQSTAPKGGVLNRFSSGQLNSIEFENAAFALNQPGEISNPIETQFGWHIIKLIEKFGLQTLDEVRSDIENKISRDDRSRIIEESMTDKIEKKYAVKMNNKMVKKVNKIITEKVLTNEWLLPEDLQDFDKEFFRIENQVYSAKDYLSFIYKQQRSAVSHSSISDFQSSKLKEFVRVKLHEYYDQNLENEFPEFANVMVEYREGLLLFDLLEKEVLNKAKTDTLGLQNFYLNNQSKYQWKDRVKGVVVSSKDATIMKKVFTMLEKGKSKDEISKTFNTTEKVNVMFQEGIYEKGHHYLPTSYVFNQGISPIIEENGFNFIVQAQEIIPAGNKTLEEVKGRVINDYQQFLEENWITSLKEEYKVEVNNDVFEKVKNELNK